jgi:hypothetical protein
LFDPFGKRHKSVINGEASSVKTRVFWVIWIMRMDEAKLATEIAKKVV